MTLRLDSPSVEVPARACRWRVPGVHALGTEHEVAAGIEDAFAFFSNAANLDTIAPSSLRFTIRTRIDDRDPGRSFTDTQLRGAHAL